ncbi:MAG TPA: FAD-binding oxidoreductase [Polyangiaceae bacterium]|nr:FAD-binding oxidoreductase [Polyangiaceae bacterium]
MRVRVTRRGVLAGVVGALPVALAARPAWHVWRAYREDSVLPPLPPPTGAQDASYLATGNSQLVRPTGSTDDVESQLRAALGLARERGLRVSIAGARHSMGGHTRSTNGIQLDLSGLNAMRLEPTGDVVSVQSGARFWQLLRFLDQHGASVRVMQSNSDFSIGGSLSVNCHGWQPNAPPIASSVESLRVMLSDGSVVTASRDQERELFSLVLGGYGLFGVILEARLRVAKNRLLRKVTREVATTDYVASFAGASTNADLAFGRLSLAPSVLMQRSLLTTYEPLPQTSLPPLGPTPESALTRALFRGQRGSLYGHELRWTAERWLGGEGGDAATRNQLLSEPVATFQNRHRDRADILQEYFVPPARLAEFAARAARLVEPHLGSLLNVTLRNVLADRDSALPYAPDERFGLVFLFDIARTSDADARLAALGRQLIDAALSLGGTYYLPYRISATPEQFERAYPWAREVFAKKRRHDPGGLFSNELYERYAG